MKCNDTSKLIIDKLAGELSPRQANKLDKHLSACYACRKESEMLNKAWQCSNETLKEDAFINELTSNRRSEIFTIAQHEEKRKRSSRVITRMVEYFAVVMICIILAGMLLPSLSVSRERARRISCPSSIQTGLGVVMDKAQKTTDKFNTEEESDEEVEEDEGKDGTAVHLVLESSSINKSRRKHKSMPAMSASPCTNAKKMNMSRSVIVKSPPAIKNKEVWKDLVAPIELSPAPEQKVDKKRIYKQLEKSERTESSYEMAPNRLSGSARYRKINKAKLKEYSKANIQADISELNNARKVHRKVASQSLISRRGLNRKVRVAKSYCKISPMAKETFKLNLKLWNMTTVVNIRKYLKENKYPVPRNIKVNKYKNTITIYSSKKIVGKIKKLFKKLQNEEKELKDLSKGLPFIKCLSRPISTFSIDTDTASYIQARKSIRQGERPNPFKIRPEEFINYFDYNYRSPVNTTFAVYPEAAPSPFRPNNTLFRVGIQGKRLGPDANTRTHYTILLDTSGSMAVKNRMELAKKALAMMLKKLKPSDYVSLLLCANKTKVVFRMRALSYDNRQRLLRILNSVTPRSVADFANGISKAYAFADRYYLRNSSNRIIIISDGIFELDNAGRQNITTQIEAARKRGISNIVIGLGGDGDDSMLEKVASIGDGSYVFLDTEREAKELFTTQFEARFREIARDVKIQVQFNPLAVKSYRQIGYKNRQLSKADFRNDKVDAGEVGSGQAVTALYELKLKSNIPKDTVVVKVRIRYKKAGDMSVEEKAFYLYESDIKEKFKTSSSNFKLASFVAEFAESLRYPETQGIASLRGVADQLNNTWMKHYRKDHKVTELLSLIKRSK